MLWKFKMETMLKVRDLWGFIDWKETKPKETIIVVIFGYLQEEGKVCIDRSKCCLFKMCQTSSCSFCERNPL
jgi:hypothetical protein